MKILIIEDEEQLAQALKKGLERHGYAADYVLDGEAGQKRIEWNAMDYDLVILDLLLPKKDGMDVCRDVRARGITTPILILTAKDTMEDKLTALDCGADDYIVKPFSFEELLARVRALLRRPKEAKPVELKARDLILNTGTREVSRAGDKIDLTLKEFALLEILMRNPNTVMDRETIISHLWGFDHNSFSNVIDVHVKNLRKKIDDRYREKLFETVRGVGYRIVA